ncbi:nucleotide exchange factor GrpE [Microbacterium pseudoresistens]|uniref:Protein GrpE n=1 Tax=Microbacterium pseudoresistens TaxID=640634 RepID=A0A7Y9EUK2_9MICO|nr:nucleotide exchange factor GrpE [Microbacterium pseudoresistens]NYD54198.1 molecular chaperone GrpE [Microbacterium pseudoresistens]
MTDKHFDENEPVEEPREGSEANASGPAPDPETDAAGQSVNDEGTNGEGADDELTVDDILASEQTPEAAAEDAALADAENALLTDLKRLQAEYANYRRRTEEQRAIDIERAKGEAAKGLLPVLDDLDRAGQHGDLVEGTPFAVIADKVRSVVERLGVEAYGAAGDEFDPQQHEAIFQQPTPGAEKATILEVVEVGYRLGGVELRPAKVVVAVPAD